MKATLMLCAMVASLQARQPILPRITPEELTRLQQVDPMVRLQEPAKGEAEVARPAGQTILGQSTILSDGTRWTLVPRGAVLHIPAKMHSRVDAEPNGELVPWIDFLRANIAWLDAIEVSIEQAAGRANLPEGSAGHWQKQGKVVVAVHQHGPISFRAAKPQHPSTP